MYRGQQSLPLLCQGPVGLPGGALCPQPGLQREQAEEAQPQIVAGFDQTWTCRLPDGTQLFAGLWDDEMVILQYAGQANLLEAVEDYDWTFPLSLT